MTSSMLIGLAQALVYLFLAFLTRQIARGRFPKDPQQREAFRSRWPILKQKSFMNLLSLLALGLCVWTLWRLFGDQIPTL